MENREVSEGWRRRPQTAPSLERKAEPEEEEQPEDGEEESQEASLSSPEVKSPCVFRWSYRQEACPGYRDDALRADGREEEEEEEEPRAPQTRWRSEGARPSDEEEEEEELRLHEASAETRKEEEEEEALKRSASSSSSRDEEALTSYGPMSPTFKKLLIQFYPDEATSRASTDGKCTIIQRTESLKKSTNSVKRTPLPVAVSKIDKKLEQYTHALEISSRENRSAAPLLTDLAAATEPVSSKKSLFEGGEAWNQNITSVTPSKDADGMKVGVAELINQWVRGGEHGSRCSSPVKPADSSSCKRYRFVVTGHGKYEKVSIDGCEDTNGQTARRFYEDL
ncbi:unnamed protein product [Tetraodon nigroviridis]|uniref:(spotted green pufferfish) hypothetical protein n=1 Tax=Tetraodon nigroviridis TaxID=99883 RepID=Q4RGJ8_TETNG|nr:unnamed protein product [Tetraodon nigroviridis]